MKSERISLIIDSVCKELGIDFCSKNPHLISLKEDVEKMSKIYLKLKEMIGIIKEIEERQNLKGLREKFDIIIKHLDETDHDVIRLAKKLQEKENE